MSDRLNRIQSAAPVQKLDPTKGGSDAPTTPRRKGAPRKKRKTSKTICPVYKADKAPPMVEFDNPPIRNRGWRKVVEMVDLSQKGGFRFKGRWLKQVYGASEWASARLGSIVLQYDENCGQARVALWRVSETGLTGPLREYDGERRGWAEDFSLTCKELFESPLPEPAPKRVSPEAIDQVADAMTSAIIEARQAEKISPTESADLVDQVAMFEGRKPLKWENPRQSLSDYSNEELMGELQRRLASVDAVLKGVTRNAV